MTRVERLAEGLWHVQDEIRMPGGVRFPLRMTVIRLAGGGLALHSPVAIDDALAAELTALGEVTHVIAPSRLHHRFVPAAAARYPGAEIWASPGAVGKLGELPVAGTVGQDARSPWDGELDAVLIAGAPKVDEVVFFHGATRTLICTDLVFHVPRPANLRTRFVLWADGAGGGRLAVGRIWRLLVADRAAARASLERVLAWDIERIVMAHGDVAEGDGRAILEDAALSRVAGAAVSRPR